jgi:hypothetical protein
VTLRWRFSPAATKPIAVSSPFSVIAQQRQASCERAKISRV